MYRRLSEEWSGKRVAVIGLGISNIALIKVLKEAGAQLSGRDRKSSSELGDRFQELQSLGIDLVLGSDYLNGLEDYDAVAVSPGVPKDLPELQAVRERGCLVSEIGLLFHYSRAPVFAVTGSSGKTTTTSLAGEMFKAGGMSTYVGEHR